MLFYFLIDIGTLVIMPAFCLGLPVAFECLYAMQSFILERQSYIEDHYQFSC